MPKKEQTSPARIAAFALALHLCLSGIVLASTVRIVIEDWDTTPPIPDQVRGWGNRFGEAELERGLGTGDFARAPLNFTIPNGLFRPWEPDPTEWTSTAQVGDKNYQALGVGQIRYLARHDVVPSVLQLDRIQTSLVLFSAEAVPDPNYPGLMVFPRVWKETEDMIGLGQGWQQFVIEVPSGSVALPSGWQAYPELPETWQNVITDVDKIGVVFGRYGFGIGGVIYGWDNALDNFSVEFRGPRIAPVYSLNKFAMILLVGVIIMFGLNRYIKQ